MSPEARARLVEFKRRPRVSGDEPDELEEILSLSPSTPRERG